MKNFNQRISALISVPIIIGVFSFPSFGESIDSLKILKIAPEEQMATVRSQDGKLTVVKSVESIGENLRIVEIAKWRVVLEERTDKGVEKVIVRLEGGKQRVERIRKTAEKQPVLIAPQAADIK